MKIEKEFKLLNILKKERTTKDNQKEIYLVLNVLDEDLNPDKFFIFNEDLIKKILDESVKAKAFQNILIDFDLVFNKNVWVCNLKEILFNYWG